MVTKLNPQQAWIEVKKKYHLSETTIQMAKRLGFNPKKLGSIANHKQEPLSDFIKTLYDKKFNKSLTKALSLI